MMLRIACAAICFGLAMGSCAATSKAGIRRMAEAHLKSCRRDNAQWPESCYSETQAYCTRMRLEKTCGEGYQP